MSNPPAKTIWEAARQLKFDQPLREDDERFVETAKARGNFTYRSLLRPLSVDIATEPWALKGEPDQVYALFCGHRGCGKSTELRRLERRLHGPALFFVVFLDALEELDINNLQYSDILMALAKRLFERLQEHSIDVDPVFLSKMHEWFRERVEKQERTKELAAEIKAGASVESGVPFFAKLFAGITNSFKVNSIYKEELRQIIRNSFSQFAEAFNHFIVAAEEEVRRHGRGRKILFIADGADRLNDDDSKRFFVSDVHQLQLIRSNFIYCAPISLVHEGNQVREVFKICMLPMIKLREKDIDTRLPDGYDCLREMIYRRVERTLFDDEETVKTLIEHSGGNPRHILRLLEYAFVNAEGERFDQPSVRKAIAAMASEYRRILEPSDYSLLHRIDRSDENDNSDRIRWLLYHLALLEYNDFWRMSHPVIRTLEEYHRAATRTEDGSGERRPHS